jgi:hypothetical protein
MRRLIVLFLAVAVFGAACRDAVSPLGHSPSALSAATAAALAPASPITLDQSSGLANDAIPWMQGETHIGKGFNPNPHVGDAVVATFYWRDSINTITTVSDHFCDVNSTPVGNTYQLVNYVTAGGYSMATYVATNVQGFSDTATNSNQFLCVHAILSDSVTEGGMILSAYRGVNTVPAWALGAHNAATGSGSTTTVADAGAVAVGAGALVYGVTMSGGVVGTDPPPGFTNITDVSDTALKADGEYEVLPGGGSADARWNWYFTSPHSWLAGTLALNPPLHLVFTVQPKTTLPMTAITPAVQVSAVDATGNTVTGFTGAVTIVIGHNGGMFMPGTLSGTKTVTAVNGVATFSDLSIDQLGNGYTLVVTAGGVTGAESASFNIGAF